MSICLNMIVKGQADSTERCIRSVAPYISAWVIGDTGSEDDTPRRIASFFAMKGIPGELHYFPFRNSGQARNEALDRCRRSRKEFDYILLIDSDMALVVDDPSFKDRLSADAYYAKQINTGTAYDNIRLVRRGAKSKYVGVAHEYLEVEGTTGNLPEIWFIDYATGSNHSGNKFLLAAELLEDELKRDPTNARNVFYLAQSYRDAGLLEKAREAYQRRTRMTGWVEEIWYSLYELGRLSERMGGSVAEVQNAYLTAYQYRPQRAEPLYQLARYHRERKEFALAYMFAKTAVMPRPADRLFIDDAVYQWRILDELSVAAGWTGAHDEGHELTKRLLAEGKVPADELPRIQKNLGFYGRMMH